MAGDPNAGARTPAVQNDLAVVDLGRQATTAYARPDLASRLATTRKRLADPAFHVFVIGEFKQGKSSLVNALLNAPVCPVDDDIATSVPTAIRFGDPPAAAVLFDPGGDPSDPDREPIREDIAVDQVAAYVTEASDPSGDRQVSSVEVSLPRKLLSDGLVIVDTPGVGGLGSAHGAATIGALPMADAVVFVSDASQEFTGPELEFLQTARRMRPNVVCVLTKTDFYPAWHDAKVRKLAQTVVPAAGLLARSRATLREAEYKALHAIASANRDDAEELFLSADRFVQAETSIPLTSLEREHLLDRFGLFGVRVAVALIRQGAATTATALSTELVRRSGLVELPEVLLSQFAQRRDVLKARSALLALESVLHEHPVADCEALASELERIASAADEFAEIRLLNALRSGGVTVKPAEVAEMERLLGNEGTALHTRLGLSPEADASEVRRALANAIGRWQRRAESPMSSREVADAARVVIRTCEGLLVSIG